MSATPKEMHDSLLIALAIPGCENYDEIQKAMLAVEKGSPVADKRTARALLGALASANRRGECVSNERFVLGVIDKLPHPWPHTSR